MLDLFIGCKQGGPRPHGSCICSSFAQVCNSARAIAPMTKTFNQLNSTQTFIAIKLGWKNAQVVVRLQAEWPQTPWQLHVH